MMTCVLQKTTARRGFMMAELIVAMAIMMAAMVGIAQLMYQVTRQYRHATQRNVVVQEAANVMEDLMSRQRDEISAAEPPRIKLSPACRQAAPDARLNIEIVSVDDGDAYRLAVRIEWPVDDPRRQRPVQLVAWRYGP